MAGIKIEQLDIGSLSRYFLNKTNFEKKIIIEALGNLEVEDIIQMGIESYLNQYIEQSENIATEDETIEVTREDGSTYIITPSKGYIKKNDDDLIVYQHPLKHDAHEIIETFDKNFVSNLEKESWNNKVDDSNVSTISEYLSKLDSGEIEDNKLYFCFADEE